MNVKDDGIDIVEDGGDTNIDGMEDERANLFLGFFFFHHVHKVFMYYRILVILLLYSI